MIEEVEILEEKDLSKFEFSKLVDVKIFKKSIGTVIINGVKQKEQEVFQPVVVCPNCGETLYELPEGMNAIETNKFLLQQSRQMFADAVKHCPKCGQKLYYIRELVSSQEGN